MSSAAAHALVRSWLETASLEDLLTDESAFGLTTASPLQRAICRIAEGSALGALAADGTVIRALGMANHVPHVTTCTAPRELAIISGIRTGKSLFAACRAVHMALQCNMDRLGPGEVPRVPIVSLSRDLAAVVFGHLTGRMQHAPMLRGLMVDQTADTVTLQRPDGKRVEIAVVAGARAGGSLVGRWVAGVIFDEFARMLGGSNEGVVNWAESRRVVLERLLPGGQIVHISSPWAPFGPAYDLVQSSWGKPSTKLVVVKAPAYDLNPHYWTPERVEAAKADPDVFRTDVEAEFATPEEALIPVSSYAAVTRESPDVLPYDPRLSYTAAMDPGMRGNGWTFTIGTIEYGKRRIVGAWEWVGSKNEPLNSKHTLSDIAAICAAYGITSVHSDQYGADPLRDIAQDFGLNLVIWKFTEAEKAQHYSRVRNLIVDGNVEFPPSPVVRTDMLRLRKVVTPSGFRIELPKSSDGRHCDNGPCIMLVLTQILDDVNVMNVETDQAAEVRKMREEQERRYGPREDDL